MSTAIVSAKELLEVAKNEIQALRRENEKLGIRVTTMNDCLALLHGRPGILAQTQMGSDIVGEIDKYLSANVNCSITAHVDSDDAIQ